MIHAALSHVHHVTLAGLLFRNFRHSGMSIVALKRLYAAHGLLKAEDADLELVKIDTIEEMCELLSGPTTVIAGQYDPEIIGGEGDTPRGDLTL